jgi:hypothetical protein
MLFYASLRLFNWSTDDPKWDRDFWAEIIFVVAHRHHTALRLTRPKRVLKPLVLSPLTSCVLSPVHLRIVIEAGERTPPMFSTRSTHLRRPAAAEKHANSARTVRRLNGLSHRRRQFVAVPPRHSQNRHRRADCPSYALGSAWDTIFVFGRARRLQTADMNSCPPLRLTRFLHNRTVSGSTLARYNSHCISRNCPFKESTVRSKSTSRSVPMDLPTVSIRYSLL